MGRKKQVIRISKLPDIKMENVVFHILIDNFPVSVGWKINTQTFFFFFSLLKVIACLCIIYSSSVTESSLPSPPKARISLFRRSAICSADQVVPASASLF